MPTSSRQFSRPLILLAASASLSSALVLPGRLPNAQVLRTRPLLAQEGGDDRAGVGFGKYEAEEARGREALEKMRAAQADRGYDNSLQGLRDRAEEPEPTPQELEKFKSNLTLGFAGFLIVGGIISLFVGGSLWEPKEGASAPAEDSSPAFGFVPTPANQPPPPSGEAAPSWAD